MTLIELLFFIFQIFIWWLIFGFFKRVLLVAVCINHFYSVSYLCFDNSSLANSGARHCLLDQEDDKQEQIIS